MAEIVQDISLRIKLDDLKTELAKIPGLTEANIKKAASAMSKEWRKAERDADKLAKRIDNTFDDSRKKVEGLGKAVDKLGFGPVVNDLRELGDGLMALGPAGGAVLLGLAAIGGAAAAIGGTATAVVALARGAAEAEENTRRLSGVVFISPENLESSKRVNAAFTLMEGIIERVGARIGADFAPQVERIATLMVAATLAAGETFNAVADGTDVAGKALSLFINAAISPMSTAWTLAVVGMISGAEMLLKAIGSDLPDSVKDFRSELVRQNLSVEAYTGSIARLEVGLGDYMGKAKKLIEVEVKRNKVVREGTAATVEQTNAFNAMILQAQNATTAEHSVADAQNERARRQIEADLAARASLAENVTANEEAATVLTSRWRAYFAELKEETGLSAQGMVDAVATSVGQIIGQLEQLGAMRQEQFEDEAARIAAERAANVAAYQAAREEYRNTRSGMSADERARVEAELSLMASAGKARNAQLRSEQKAAQRAAVRSFQAQKLAAISQTFISAGLASMKAIEMFGPPPSPPGIAALAAVGVTQGASIGLIAAQKPPTFHRGGAPDEVAATLTRGEAVLSPRGVAAMGGNEGIKALNRGEHGGGSGGGGSAVYLDGRLLRQLRPQILSGAGASLRGMVGSGKPGTRTGYDNG